MKKLLLTISTLTITFTSTIIGEILMPKKVSAYCVYNRSNTTITAVQLPLSEGSFKAVIQPGNKSPDGCCPWDEPTCVAGGKLDKEAKTPFLIYKGDIDEYIRSLRVNDAVTGRRLIKKINSDLEPSIQNILSTPGIPTIKSEIAENIYSLLGKYNIPKEQALGVVQTYNGGIVFYNGSVPLGCWIGPCKGQDINRNGTRGILR